MVPELLVLSLDYYREPLRYPDLADVTQPLPASINTQMSAFGNALASDQIESTAAALGTQPAQLREAAHFFVRHVLLAPRADHYRVLGLPRNPPEEQVKEHYRLLIRMFHPDRPTAENEWSNIFASRINDAYNVLRNSETRRRYDRELATNSPRAVVASPTERRSHRHRRRDWRRYGQSHRFKAPSWSIKAAAWASGATVLLIVMTVVYRETMKSTLRVNPQLAEQPRPGPAFLQGSQAERAPVLSGSPGPTEVRRPSPNREMATDLPLGSMAVADPTPPGNTLEGAYPQTARRHPRPVQGALGSPLSSTVPPKDVRAAQANTALELSPDKSPAVPNRTSSDKPQPRSARTKSTMAAKREVPKQVTQPPKMAKHAPPVEPRPNVQQRPEPRPKPAVVEPDAEDLSRTATISKHFPISTGGRQRENPTQVIERLRHAYQTGDLGALLRLFADNAQITGGTGLARIRDDYAQLFAKSQQRRMTIRNILWRTTTDGTLIGQGELLVGVRFRGSGAWQSALGTVTIELIPDGGSYQISKLFHNF